MKRIFKTLAAVFAIFLMVNMNSAYGIDDEEYIMGDIDTLPADFDLDVTVTNESGATVHENGIPVVDRVCVFRIGIKDGNSSSYVYDVSLFEDRQFSRMFKSRSLPFVEKRNYKGIIDGEYRITFVAKDASGKIGKGSVTIRVKH